MPEKRPPKEVNVLAKYIVDVSTGETEKIEPPKKNPAAQALSKLGASKGGKARAKKLSSAKRKAIAKKAAKMRWADKFAQNTPLKRSNLLKSCNCEILRVSYEKLPKFNLTTFEPPILIKNSGANIPHVVSVSKSF